MPGQKISLGVWNRLNANLGVYKSQHSYRVFAEDTGLELTMRSEAAQVVPKARAKAKGRAK